MSSTRDAVAPVAEADRPAREPTFDTAFDAERLSLFPARVAEWQETGRTSAPIYTEFELTTGCNHACRFCGVEHIVNTPARFIDPALAERTIDELAAMGNRSIMFSGHGEPLLHPHAAGLIGRAAKRMSASVTTNGRRLRDAGIGLMDDLKWIRFSINGSHPLEYARMHRTRPSDFEKVVANLEAAVARKRSLELALTIGVQLVLLDQNPRDVERFVLRVREIGADYFSLKPYSEHPMSARGMATDVDVFEELAARIAPLTTDSFAVIARVESARQTGREKPYGQCHGTNFMNFVGADGRVWECNVFAGDDDFLIGDLHTQSMPEIWDSLHRRHVLDFVENKLDLGRCRDVCRMHQSNRFLWRLRHPLAHDDFI